MKTVPGIAQALQLNNRLEAVKETRNKCFEKFNRTTDEDLRITLQEACQALTAYEFELHDKIEKIATSIVRRSCCK